MTVVVAITTSIALAVLGGLGASVSGAGIVKGALRDVLGRACHGCDGRARHDLWRRGLSALQQVDVRPRVRPPPRLMSINQRSSMKID